MENACIVLLPVWQKCHLLIRHGVGLTHVELSLRELILVTVTADPLQRPQEIIVTLIQMLLL